MKVNELSREQRKQIILEQTTPGFYCIEQLILGRAGHKYNVPEDLKYPDIQNKLDKIAEKYRKVDMLLDLIDSVIDADIFKIDDVVLLSGYDYGNLTLFDFTIKSLEYLKLGMLMGLENGTMRLVSIVDIRILYDNKSVLVKDYLEILEEEAIKKIENLCVLKN